MNFRLNVIDSIEHFCVDMLEFPDYIPIEAVVCLVIGSSEQDLIKRMLQYDLLNAQLLLKSK